MIVIAAILYICFGLSGVAIAYFGFEVKGMNIKQIVLIMTFWPIIIFSGRFTDWTYKVSHKRS